MVNILIPAIRAASAPSVTRSLWQSSRTARLSTRTRIAPAGRPGTAEEIADAIVFLISDRAGFVHGAVLRVDGGRTAV